MEMRIVQVSLPTGCMCRPCVPVEDKVPEIENPTEPKNALDTLPFVRRSVGWPYDFIDLSEE